MAISQNYERAFLRNPNRASRTLYRQASVALILKDTAPATDSVFERTDCGT